MSRTTFSGPVSIGNRDLGAGTLVASRSTTITVTAVANTDFTEYLPTTATILRATVVTSTAFTGATVTLQIGTAVGGAQVVAATDIKAAGAVSLTYTAAGFALTGAQTLYIRVVQTTPTAVGAAKLLLEYIPA